MKYKCKEKLLNQIIKSANKHNLFFQVSTADKNYLKNENSFREMNIAIRELENLGLISVYRISNSEKEDYENIRVAHINLNFKTYENMEMIRDMYYEERKRNGKK